MISRRNGLSIILNGLVTIIDPTTTEVTNTAAPGKEQMQKCGCLFTNVHKNVYTLFKLLKVNKCIYLQLDKI